MTLPATTATHAEGKRLMELIGTVLAEAKRLGATQAEAGASVDSGLSVTVRKNQVETLEHQQDRGLGLTVYFGKRKGTASTGDMQEPAVMETVAKACSIARHTGDDDYAGLADADRMPTSIPDLDLSHPWELMPEQAIELAAECEAEALNFDTRIDNSEGATLSTNAGVRAYGNSHEFLASYPATSHSLSCVVLGRDDNGQMQRDYWYTASRDPAVLDSGVNVGRRAAERTVNRLGARKISTRKAPILFPAELARGLIGHFVAAVRGSSQYRQASFLLDAAGESVFPEFLSMVERPHLLRALGSAPFDNEGVATANRDLVRDGKLAGYVLSSYSARKLGLETTGNAGGVHNLIVSHREKDFDALLKEMNSGLLVTELMGQGVNTVTGDYSRGAVGFWVENGVIDHPIHEVTIAGNLKDMYGNLVDTGNDTDVRGSIQSGSILLEEMTIAGD